MAERFETKASNVKVKHKLEDRLHELVLVCDRSVNLREAQQAIANEWIAAYTTYIAHQENSISQLSL
jgi:hypothetical protein